ncbi:MAG: hypothetical protein ACM3SU_17060 [Acidobacteriota bacterium]
MLSRDRAGARELLDGALRTLRQRSQACWRMPGGRSAARAGALTIST